MLSKGRMAACALFATLTLSGLAVAQDRDDDQNRDQDRCVYQDRDGYQDRDRDDRRVYRDQDGDRDRDGDRYGNQGYGYRGGNAARSWGYRDGQDAARGDSRVGKSYNPRPRGRYEDRDRGYKNFMGNVRTYRQQYDQAYREGYAVAWNSGGRWRR